VIAHVNAVGAEGVYLMTERLVKTAKEERAIFRQADGRRSLYLVAVVEGRIVGTSDIGRGRHSKNRHTASLGIALGKDARGVGLGRAMMQVMIDWARSRGVRKLTLGVFASNRRAVALYKKLGFTEEGRLKGQVVLRGKLVDELLLARWVKRPPKVVDRERDYPI
jgi:RimJ/RimL family protein N-acetyltransferase